MTIKNMTVRGKLMLMIGTVMFWAAAAGVYGLASMNSSAKIYGYVINNEIQQERLALTLMLQFKEQVH